MAGGPSVRLYRAEFSTNCERVGLALAHKQIEAQSVLIEYSDRRPVEAISGQGRVPVIEDAGQVVHDSVAIIRHLERRTPEPPLLPAEPLRRAELDLFIDWFERIWKFAPDQIEAELERDRPDRALIERYSDQMRDRMDRFEMLLDGRDFLWGPEFGAADCVAYPFLKYAAGRDPADTELFHVVLDEHQPLEGHERLHAWIERVGALPRAY